VHYTKLRVVAMSEISHEESKVYLLNRFSENLTKYDVKNLFETLRKEKGSLLAATKEIAIERKTVYDWDSNNSEVRLATKRKVLSASLDDDFAKTLSYLMEKSLLDYSEICERYNTLLFEELMTCDRKPQFEDVLAIFEKTLRHNRTLISGEYEERVIMMIDEINRKAQQEFGLNGIDSNFALMSTDKLASKFLLLVDVLSEQKLRKNEISAALHLPKSFIDNICTVYGYLGPADELNLREKNVVDPMRREPIKELLPMQNRPSMGYIASRELI
jgi:hypothetical protein